MLSASAIRAKAMRTTIQIDDDVFQHAKHLAAAQARPLGAVVSELMRKGIKRSQAKLKTRNGFPLFDVPSGGKTFSLEDVKRAEDEDDEQYAGRSA